MLMSVCIPKPPRCLTSTPAASFNKSFTVVAPEFAMSSFVITPTILADLSVANGARVPVIATSSMVVASVSEVLFSCAFTLEIEAKKAQQPTTATLREK